MKPGDVTGPYEILAPVGEGGMGEVFRARDRRLGRDVAVKTLGARLRGDAAIARFEREARAVAALSHPNVLAIHDVGAHEGVPYAVMELLEGRSLRDLLRSGPLSISRSVEIALQVARGLAAAHAKGIVHRDLKPGNVFVTTDGQVKVLDFGLAKQAPAVAPGSGDASEQPTEHVRTSPGTVLGTVGYMAPEQIVGHEVDARADLFAFGVLLYEMLAGRKPFERGSAAEVLAAILREDPPEIVRSDAALPPPLVRIVNHCLEKDPEARFQSARDVAFALETLGGSTVTPLPAATIGLPKGRWRRSVLAVVGALLLAAAALVAHRLGARSARPGPPTFEQVTFRRGLVRNARFSMDGHTIYYGAEWDGGPLEVFSKRLDSVESQPVGLTGLDVASVSSGEMAVRSRDVSGLMVGSRRGTLSRILLAGGLPRPAFDNVLDADYAPGTNDLAVVFDDGAQNRIEFPPGTVLCRGEVLSSPPRFSPSGDLLAFVGNRVPGGSGRSMVLVDRKGEKRVLFSGVPMQRFLHGIAWRPDGEEIYFERAGMGELAAVDLSGEVRTVVRTPLRLRVLDVSPDGSILVSLARVTVETFGLLAGDVAPRSLSYLDRTEVAKVFPDGKSWAFRDHGSLYLQKADGSPPLRLVAGLSDYGILSPDGTWAVVIQGGSPFLVPSGTGTPVPLSAGDLTTYRPAAWFPTGNRILVSGSRKGGAWSQFVQDVPGGVPRPIGEGLLSSQDAISPDGRWTTARRLSDPTATFFQFPVDGGAPKPIPGFARGDEPVAYADDGRHLFVMEAASGPVVKIVRLDLSTGRREPWWTVSPPDPAGINDRPYVCVTGNGRFYAASYERNLSDLYLVREAR